MRVSFACFYPFHDGEGEVIFSHIWAGDRRVTRGLGSGPERREYGDLFPGVVTIDEVVLFQRELEYFPEFIPKYFSKIF